MLQKHHTFLQTAKDYIALLCNIKYIRQMQTGYLLSPTRIGNLRAKTPKLFITSLNEPIRLTLDLRENSATELSGMQHFLMREKDHHKFEIWVLLS